MLYIVSCHDFLTKRRHVHDCSLYNYILWVGSFFITIESIYFLTKRRHVHECNLYKFYTGCLEETVDSFCITLESIYTCCYTYNLSSSHIKQQVHIQATQNTPQLSYDAIHNNLKQPRLSKPCPYLVHRLFNNWNSLRRIGSRSQSELTYYSMHM